MFDSNKLKETQDDVLPSGSIYIPATALSGIHFGILSLKKISDSEGRVQIVLTINGEMHPCPHPIAEIFFVLMTHPNTPYETRDLMAVAQQQKLLQYGVNITKVRASLIAIRNIINDKFRSEHLSLVIQDDKLTSRLMFIGKYPRYEGIPIKLIASQADIDKSDATLRTLDGFLEMNQNKHSTNWKGSDVALTVTEFKFLWELAVHVGVVKSRDRLMEIAYPNGETVTDRAIDSHIKRLRNKLLVVDPSFSMIETLYGVGYRYKQIT